MSATPTMAAPLEPEEVKPYPEVEPALPCLFWFLGLPTGVTPVPLLAADELCRFKNLCRGAREAADAEFRTRFRHFKYVPGFLEPRLQLTRSGRSVVSHFAASGGAAERGLVRFLAQSHHAQVFEDMDLSEAPVRALENTFLQGALSAMPHLRHIIIPWHGWSTSVARRCFLRALPARISYESTDASGCLMPRGKRD